MSRTIRTKENIIARTEHTVIKKAAFAQVKLGRISGLDPAAAELFHQADFADDNIIRLQDWDASGLELMFLDRLPILVGHVDGASPLTMLTNSNLVVAARHHWPNDRHIPALVLPTQTRKTIRKRIAGGCIIARNGAGSGSLIAPRTLYKLWLELVQQSINPLAGTTPSHFLKAMCVSARSLQQARPDNKGGQE